MSASVRIAVAGIKLVTERTLNYAWGRKIGSPEDAAMLFKAYLGEQDREHFVMAMLDTKHTVRALHTVSIGSLDASIAHPREVYKPAVLANSASIIVCHNHPSGDPDPSQEDLSVTERLVAAGKVLGIAMLDHVILGERRYVSLRERGLIQ